MPEMHGGDVVWDIRGDLSDINSAVMEAENRIRESFGRAATYVGGAMIAVGTAIEGALLASANAAISWESAFTGVRKTVDASTEEFAAMEQGLIDMSKRIPVAATELAGFAEIGGQMGVPKEQILAFTETIAILGETTNLAGEEGAAMLAQFATVAQVPQSEYSNLAAAIVDLGNAGSSTEKEILSMGQRLAAAGAIAGLSAGDILGISNALVSVGIEAEAGGTAFSKIFTDMKKSVETGKGNLQNFAEIAGVTAQQFADTFNRAPAEAITMFIQGLAKIEESGGSLFQMMDQLDYKEIRLSNTTLSATMSAQQFAESIKLGNVAFAENNAHLVEAEKRFATTESAIQMAKNSMWALAQAVGNAFLPGIQAFSAAVQWATGLIEGWARANPELTSTIALVASALGAFLIVVGSILMALPLLAGGIAIVGAPLLIVAAKVGVLLAALGAAAYAIYNFAGSWDIFGIVMDWVHGVIDSARQWMTANWEQIVRIFSIAKEGIWAILTVLGNVIGLIFKTIVTVMGTAFGEIGEGWNYMVNGTDDSSKTILDTIEGFVKGWVLILERGAEIFATFVGWIEEHWYILENICWLGSNLVMEPFFWLMDKLTWAIGHIVDGVGWLFGWMASMWGSSGEIQFDSPQMPGMATGGVVKSAGMALVGEKGPELVRMPAGAEVIPADQSRKMMNGGAGGSGGTNINVYLNTTMDLDSPGVIEKIGRLIAEETSVRLRGVGVIY